MSTYFRLLYAQVDLNSVLPKAVFDELTQNPKKWDKSVLM